MIRKWLIVLFVPTFFQILFLILLLKFQADQDQAQFWAIHTTDVIALGEGVAREIAEARSDVLSRLVTGDGSPALYENLVADVPKQMEKLRVKVKDNTEGQRVRADEIALGIGASLAWLNETNRLVRTKNTSGATARFKQGDQKLDKIRGTIIAFLDKERQFDTERRVTLKRSSRLQIIAIVSAVVVSAILALGLFIAFSRGFARRVATLAENARKLAEGKALSEPLKGDDEIVQLDNMFHSMAKSLAERDRENEMFIYSVSHDLRSPLVNLQGFSKELTYTCDDMREALAPLAKPANVEQRLKRLLDEDMPSSVHFIQTAVSRLSAIIDSLLRLSRAGRVEYQMQEVDVQGVVTRVVEALRSSVKEKQAEIRVGSLPPAWGDPTAVEQVFANLLSNAVKYLDPARPGIIEVGTREEVGGTSYFVRDNGLGIPSAHQNKLFVAFQRLHPGVAAGEGVGLALIRRMVERMGGKIWAESEPGAGTTFLVNLPPRPAEAILNGRNSSAVAVRGESV